MILSEILEGITYSGYCSNEEISFITDDSRKAAEGCLFICISGNNFDGHSVAEEMLAKGAVAVVAERDLGLERQIVVENTRSSFSRLCAAFYDHPEYKIDMVGITGTNGKTTTCFVLKELFERAGYKCGLIGTVKNLIGDREVKASFTTPGPNELFALLAQMADDGCTHCFMEVSSQALAQGRVDAIRFAAAVFTNLTQDHLDYHGTMENYMAAKKILFSMSDRAVANYDDSKCAYMLEGINSMKFTYSIESDFSSYSAKNIRLAPDSVEYELVSDGRMGHLHFGVPGRFSVYNSMAAAVTAVELGLDFDEVLKNIALCGGVPGRMEVVPTGRNVTAIVDYAHTPDGLENAIKALKETAAGRVITVFGCGGDRDRKKRPIMGKTVSAFADVAIVTSDNPRTENPDEIIKEITAGMSGEYYVEPDRKKATALALSIAASGDVVLVAGKGHEDYQIIGKEKIHYDDREIIRELTEN